MPSHLILVENTKDWAAEFPDVELITARDYLMQPDQYKTKGLHIVNLCRSYRYCSTGYYCSLLAEARGHRILPGVRTINDLAESESYPVDLEELNRRMSRLISRRQSQLASTRLEFVLVFGEAPLVDLKPLGRALYELFPVPLLQVVLERHTLWHVSSVRIVAPTELGEVDDRRFADADVVAADLLIGKLVVNELIEHFFAYVVKHLAFFRQGPPQGAHAPQIGRRRLVQLVERNDVIIDNGDDSVDDLRAVALRARRAPRTFRSFYYSSNCCFLARIVRIGNLVDLSAVVWLDVPLAVIERRLSEGEREARPLYRDFAAVSELYERRRPSYQAAGVRVEIEADESPEAVADRVVDTLAES